jgi:hypothetical protein
MSQFTRISKAEARKRYDEGETLIVCPNKIRPGYPFAMHSTIHSKEWLDSDYSFESMLNQWAYYNASYETGYYAHYYTEEGQES